MSTLPSLLRSVALTGFFSFMLPCLLIGLLSLCLALLSFFPGLAVLSEAGLQQVSYFLEIFGNGNTIVGILLIGLVCSLVGVLFDISTFYRHQKFSNHS